jgi:hypothetical protein
MTTTGLLNVSSTCAVSQGRVVESRHRIALSHVAIATALVRITRERHIGGASDGGGGEERLPCTHTRMSFSAGGTYEEACRERDIFVADFQGFLVSAVYRHAGGGWGWDLCPTCTT